MTWWHDMMTECLVIIILVLWRPPSQLDFTFIFDPQSVTPSRVLIYSSHHTAALIIYIYSNQRSWQTTKMLRSRCIGELWNLYPFASSFRCWERLWSDEFIMSFSTPWASDLAEDAAWTWQSVGSKSPAHNESCGFWRSWNLIMKWKPINARKD